MQIKLGKIEKMIKLSSLQHLNDWNMAYIFQTYAMPHIKYAASTLFLTSDDVLSMRSHSAYKTYKKLSLILLRELSDYQ